MDINRILPFAQWFLKRYILSYSFSQQHLQIFLRFLETSHESFFFFLAFSPPQMKCHAALLHWRDGRHLCSRLAHTETILKTNSATAKRKTIVNTITNLPKYEERPVKNVSSPFLPHLLSVHFLHQMKSLYQGFFFNCGWIASVRGRVCATLIFCAWRSISCALTSCFWEGRAVFLSRGNVLCSAEKWSDAECASCCALDAQYWANHRRERVSGRLFFFLFFPFRCRIRVSFLKWDPFLCFSKPP